MPEVEVELRASCMQEMCSTANFPPKFVVIFREKSIFHIFLAVEMEHIPTSPS